MNQKNKDGETPRDVAKQNGHSHVVKYPDEVSKQPRTFWDALLDTDDGPIGKKITELISKIESVHEMNFFYTFLSLLRRSGSLSANKHEAFIAQALEKTATTTATSFSVVHFKRIIEKAFRDGLIAERDGYDPVFDRNLELENAEHKPFIEDIQEHLRNADILPVHVECMGEKQLHAVSKQLKQICETIDSKTKVNSAVCFISFVLNVLSWDAVVGGPPGYRYLELGSIVDYSDLYHVTAVLNSFDKTTMDDCFWAAMEFVANTGGHFCEGVMDTEVLKLTDSLRKNDDGSNEKHVLTTLFAAAELAAFRLQDDCTGHSSFVVRLEKLKAKLGLDEYPSRIGPMEQLELLDVKILGEVQRNDRAPTRLVQLETQMTIIEDGIEWLEGVFDVSGADILERMEALELAMLGDNAGQGSLSARWVELGESGNCINLDDINMDKIDDTGRMLQRKYDDAVVELACANYESYHGITRGTIKFNQLRATSAGIQGWAACTFNDENNAVGSENCEEAERHRDRQTPKVKSDEVEARRYRETLLQSIGSRTPCHEPAEATQELYIHDDEEYIYEDEHTSDNESTIVNYSP